jgi:hypothetical protein
MSRADVQALTNLAVNTAQVAAATALLVTARPLVTMAVPAMRAANMAARSAPAVMENISTLLRLSMSVLAKGTLAYMAINNAMSPRRSSK